MLSVLQYLTVLQLVLNGCFQIERFYESSVLKQLQRQGGGWDHKLIIMLSSDFHRTYQCVPYTAYINTFSLETNTEFWVQTTKVRD